ncbi:MAG: hypothetical protein ACREF7_04340, partial [Candidatus Saccharimonadales bacterium]
DELQAEPWTPTGETIQSSTLAEQNKSLSPSMLKGRFAFGKSTGMRDVIMWGAEYWYYRMEIEHDPSLWNIAKQEFKTNNFHSGEYLLSHPNL